MDVTTLRFGVRARLTDVVRRCKPHRVIVGIAALLTICLTPALPLAGAAQPQSNVCRFYENPLTQEFIAQLRDYDVLEAQEQLVSSCISFAASGYGLEVAGRSPFARQAPTDFVVLRMFYCGVGSSSEAVGGSVCHGAEAAMQKYEKNNATRRIKAVRVNKEYKKLQLLGLDEQRQQGHKLQTVGSKRAVNEPARELVGVRKDSALLVDTLGARELWDRGFKGQGVKVGIFDTGLSSKLTNVKERINWTHEPKNTDSVGHGTFVAGVISGTDEKCPGIAPEAELFVFRMFTGEQLSFTSWYLDAFNYALFKGIHVLNLSTGGPDFQDMPFVEKVQELAANGIILVSAVGNDGPHYGLLSNPADQAEVIGVGGVTKDNEIAEFSSRGMTTWELPFGSGRVKPDIVTLAKDVPGSDALGGCKVLSGTSASSPIVSASIALLASMIPAEERWSLINPASMKQILLESADRLEARRDSEHVVRNHIFEQGSGVLNISKASKVIESLWTRHQAVQSVTQSGKELRSVLKPSSFPDRIDTTDCPRMWPYCSQPLYHSALPLMVNLTIMNPASVVGTIKKPPQWISETNGEHLTVSTSSPFAIWPYVGSIGVFIEVKEKAAAFEGIAKGELRFEVENANQVDELLIPVTIKIVPTPPASKRILWDQFHNIPYPSAFVPRDNLENQHDLMDVGGDHPHTNYHQLWNFLTSEGFYVDILPFEYSCLDLGKYGVVMIVDPEEEFFRDEIVALQAAIKYSNVSLIVFADWYDNRMLDSLELFDTSTLSKWHAITGGANIPAINKLLHDFHIAFGDGVVYSSSVSLLNSGNDSSFPYWSGSYLTNFPVGGYLGYIDAADQSARTLNRSEHTLTDVPVLGLYEVPSIYGGRIAVFGDSSCLDSSVHPAAKFRHCFGMLRSILRFTNDAVLPSSISPQDDSASTGLQRLELEFVADKSRLHPLVDLQDENIWQLRARHTEFAKHSKVLQASEGKSIHRSFCKFYTKERRTMTSSATSSAELYMVLSNKSGRQNLGTYLRTASAFGTTQVLVVGSERFGTHGAHRAQKYVDVVHVYDFVEAREYLKAKGCTIFALSKQSQGSYAAHATPYEGTSAFVIDNEFPGLSEEQRAICDHFIHVPFHGEQTEASSALALDTTVVTAITLHHFTAFAQFPVRAIEATSTQGKFVLDAYPTFDPTQNQRGEEKAAMREAKRANADDGLSEGGGLGSMFE
ncbi:Membrane-bound transcription factor site-1 protease [Phytophthora fragariae]|uniref:subtilisin n=1 Tax=Phytophthora fragariae TaxID=53985 RepID=A0A6A3ZKN5_9STRA|nr:Membrane-bound transcription factor site-1 protease [Phytophthora fragariae]KAE8936605.1 Membrane-bound transcription factor site-1 protease [Phytophthora fragariae]KAE9109786.1 Membrane-bound transcription factor site-1 protease [Phytophthora fragariae]KAE9109874.1 Membrane-bound transcription factor site-1 protease [Phytophthora fragariae]KAE9144004.1 Membrane-bound transcription factor site-1 protease [Phytophthora fragariae]